MDGSLIPRYNSFLQMIKTKGITKITCNELFAQYGYIFDNKHNLFKLCLEYLENQGEILIERPAFNDALFLSIEVL